MSNMKGLYDIAMDLCRMREHLAPITKGEIRKGHATGKDLALEPGMRKTMLKDAREICGRQQLRLNTAADLILEHDKLGRAAMEQLEDWVKRIRRGDMGDFSPMMDEIFDTEDLIKKLRAACGPT